MIDFFELIIKIFFAILAIDILGFIYSIIKKRQDIADVIWGLKFIFIAVLSLLFTQSYNILSYLLIFLITTWGLRLSIHIGLRHLKKTEDKRYKEIARNWGQWFYLRSFIQNFLLQGLLAIIVSLPVMIIIYTQPSPNYFLIFSGTFIWAFGFLFEAISDFELSIFKKEPKNKGKIMTTGLWKYSRHPNYFGEVLLWWGVFIISLHQIGYWYFSIIGPATITILIIFISGIPLNEKRYAGNKEYDLYKKKVSSFFPLPPKN